MPAPAPLTLLVAEGDSITAGASGYAAQWAAGTPDVPFVNCAVGGSSITTMTARLAATMAHDPSHMTILIGANDIGSSTVPSEYVDAILNYVAAAKAIKPTLVVGVGGVLPIDENAPANSPPAKHGFNAIARAVNALLRARVGAGIDFYIPMGDAFADADAQNPSLSSDGLHWLTPGQQRIGAVYAAVMNPIAAGANLSTPTAFQFIDQSNAPPESTQHASVFVTGMRLARTATATLSGSGDFRRGQGAFGTLPLTVINGDMVTSRIEASAEPESTVSQTITIGGIHDTFTVTTTPESGAADFTHGEQRYIDKGGFTPDPFTFTNVVFPAGRPILVTWKNAAAASAVMIDGTPCSKATSATTWDGMFDMWIGPDELATGERDVIVTGTNNNRCAIFAGAVAGASATPTGTSKANFAFRADGDLNGDTAIAIGSGGVRIMFGFASGGVDNWYDNTPVHSYPAGWSDYPAAAFWAKAAASGTPKFRQAAFGDNLLMAAGFNA